MLALVVVRPLPIPLHLHPLGRPRPRRLPLPLPPRVLLVRLRQHRRQRRQLPCHALEGALGRAGVVEVHVGGVRACKAKRSKLSHRGWVCKQS